MHIMLSQKRKRNIINQRISFWNSDGPVVLFYQKMTCAALLQAREDKKHKRTKVPVCLHSTVSCQGTYPHRYIYAYPRQDLYALAAGARVQSETWSLTAAQGFP